MTDTNVTALRPGMAPDAPPEPNPHLVEILEAVLKQAREGKLQQLACIGIDFAGNTGQAMHCDAAMAPAMAGALARCQLELLLKSMT